MRRLTRGSHISISGTGPYIELSRLSRVTSHVAVSRSFHGLELRLGHVSASPSPVPPSSSALPRLRLVYFFVRLRRLLATPCLPSRPPLYL